MKEATLIWKKEETRIKQVVPVCECGKRYRLKGSAGCYHDENYAYTYQCEGCKNIEMTDGVFSFNSEENFAEAGWKTNSELA